jgi:hypothetical protein
MMNQNILKLYIILHKKGQKFDEIKHIYNSTNKMLVDSLTKASKAQT